MAVFGRECADCRLPFQTVPASDVVRCHYCRLVRARLSRLLSPFQIDRFMRQPRRDLAGEMPVTLIANGRKAAVDYLLDVLIPQPNQ